MELVEIKECDVGKRLDVFMQEKLDQSRSHIKNMIENGDITFNGKIVKCGQEIKSSSRIEFQIVQPKQISTQPDDSIDFEIVYEDDDLLVINKPQGLVVHPCQSTTSKTLVNGLLAKVKNLSGINGEIRPGIVHRLDKNTSGVMLVAKNDKAHVSLSKQIETKTCVRKYYALLEGVLAFDEKEINANIARDKKDRKKMAVCPKGEGRSAISLLKVVRRYSSKTLCEFTLKTGRTHQIRVHAKYINHPVVGDDVYNTKLYPSLAGQLLHSHFISFAQPTTGERLQFEVPLPKYFENFLSNLK